MKKNIEGLDLEQLNRFLNIHGVKLNETQKRIFLEAANCKQIYYIFPPKCGRTDLRAAYLATKAILTKGGNSDD